jgi:hypothetical protein
MFASLSVFLNFNLPNATTWFYFSFLLALSLFFKFARLLSVRNWDVVFLFLLTPGLLLVQPQPEPNMRAASAVGQFAGAGLPDMVGALGMMAEGPSDVYSAARWTWAGYLWLLCGSAYFFIRCLFDLALVQRPALAPNLTFGGMAWLAAALFICLLAVAFRQPDRNQHAPQRPASEGVQSAANPIGREGHVQEIAREWFDEWFNPPDWVRRGFAGLCHLAVILGLVFVAHRHFHDASAGMAAATFYLMLPYTGLYVSQVHHVWPIALIVWALAAYRLPTLSGALLGIAAGTAYFPALVFPLWVSFYWKRGAGRFFLAFTLSAAFCLTIVATDLIMKEKLDESINEVLKQDSWQPWRVPTTDTEGFWTGMHWAYRIPVFLGYLAFVIATAFWPAPKNLAQVIALSAAVIIGIQFWYADKGGVYVLWYLPLILLLVFRPNLADRRPDLIQAERDWVYSSRMAVGRFFRWLFHMLLPHKEEPATR